MNDIKTLDERIEEASHASITVAEQLSMSRDEVAELRAALAARATPAQSVPEISYAISVKETGADLVINRIDGDITTVLHSEFHPMGDTYGLLLEAPEDEEPSPSSVGAAIRSLPLPEHIARADSAINETGALVAVWMNRTGTLSYDTKVYTEAQMRALLSEAAALAEQVRGCTCPSGDGSLRWPCPKHEQLPVAITDKTGPNGIKWYVAPDLPDGVNLYAEVK